MEHSILKKQCSTKLQLKRQEEDERLVDQELQLSTWKLSVKSYPETKTLIIYIKEQMVEDARSEINPKNLENCLFTLSVEILNSSFGASATLLV